MDLTQIIWECRICHSWRPDEKTSVSSRRLSDGYPAHLRFGVVYCNDRAECVAAATAPGPWLGWPPVEREAVTAGTGGSRPRTAPARGRGLGTGLPGPAGA